MQAPVFWPRQINLQNNRSILQLLSMLFQNSLLLEGCSAHLLQLILLRARQSMLFVALNTYYQTISFFNLLFKIIEDQRLDNVSVSIDCSETDLFEVMGEIPAASIGYGAPKSALPFCKEMLMQLSPPPISLVNSTSLL